MATPASTTKTYSTSYTEYIKYGKNGFIVCIIFTYTGLNTNVFMYVLKVNVLYIYMVSLLTIIFTTLFVDYVVCFFIQCVYSILNYIRCSLLVKLSINIIFGANSS